MKVKSEREFAQACPTLSDPMDCSPPGSSVHGIFQARVLEWGAIAFSGAASKYIHKLLHLMAILNVSNGIKVHDMDLVSLSTFYKALQLY